MNPNDNVLAISLTERGAALARRLPFTHHHGNLAKWVRTHWASVDAFVLICATGIAARVIGPLLSDKQRDPAVVCVDDQGRWAIALAGGHHGANDLAREVAGLIGAEPVVTTATEGSTALALDALGGFHASGDIAGVTRAWLDGYPPIVDQSDLPTWPLPKMLRDVAETPSHLSTFGAVQVTDQVDMPSGVGQVILRPPSLVVGVGSSSGADPDGIAVLAKEALAVAGLDDVSVGLLATLDRKKDEPGIVALAEQYGVELRTFPAESLERVEVPNPSVVVARAVGTRSVAEAAAVLAAGPGGELVVTKWSSHEATVAVARRVRPEGELSVVGLGPGDPAWLTPAAVAAVQSAEVVIGYGPYVDFAEHLLGRDHEVVRSPIGCETERCQEALGRAASGQRVALVCSGDPGVFAMASLVCELAPQHGDPPLHVVPGVTAALGAAAVLGAPLGHDHAAVSLSDLLTPWPVVERRVKAVAEGDLVVSFYNPRSSRRTWQLGRAVDILRRRRPAACPVAVVSDVGRPGQRVVRTTLDRFDAESSDVDMGSLVVVGSSSTRWMGERMVTPRGYGPLKEPRRAAE